MKIALAQINTAVGDLTGNHDKILCAYNTLCNQGAEMVIFPELVVCGYPPRDLLFKSSFVTDNLKTLHQLAKHCDRIPALIGFVDRTEIMNGNTVFFNAAAWCCEKKVQAIAHKCLLPNYDVFDEQRYFRPGKDPLIVAHLGQRIGITICEDIWTSLPQQSYLRYRSDPVQNLAERNIDLLLNLSASPWHYGKLAQREQQLHAAARRCVCPVVYCNAVGANDELIFDGRSLVLNTQGAHLAELPKFSEGLRTVDTTVENVTIDAEFASEGCAEIESALILGVRDYAHKSDFKRAVIGLSGGIDSAVTAVIAVRALGIKNVIGIALPSALSSQHSRDDAAALAQNLGIEFKNLSIAAAVEAVETTLQPLFNGFVRDVTEENIQARMRGLLLMALANKWRALLLTTGNKSELAVGYCTLYGDMCGGLAVISDVPKCLVYRLAKWINRKTAVIPQSTIEKPPSAELHPDQKDQDSLPSYAILDSILERYVEQFQSPQEIIESGFDVQIVREVIRKVDANEYKRKQAAPGLKITPLAFGVGRRMPIVQKYYPSIV